MDIVINHLSRTAPGQISVAGIFLPDLQTHIHPHPTKNGHFTSDMSLDRGGPFAIGALINIDAPQWLPARPHIEDHIVAGNSISVKGRMSPADFWEVLESNAKTSLVDIFGPELRASGTNFNWRVLDENQGLLSLGLLRLNKNAILTVDGGMKIWLTETGARASLRVTDLRLHYDDGSIRYDLADAVAERLAEGEHCILSVGLTRSFSRTGSKKYHFVQVNNIYFEEDPLGDSWFSA